MGVSGRVQESNEMFGFPGVFIVYLHLCLFGVPVVELPVHHSVG